MAFEPQHRALTQSALALLCAALGCSAVEVRADDAVGTLQPPCPRIASPAGQSYLQPARLPASQVAAKNKLGCLSPADAIYGPDGCPLRYCGASSGTFQIPAATPSSPAAP